MASLQEGRNSHRSAPFLSLLRGVTTAACLGGGSSGRELAYQICTPSPLGHSTRPLPWLREGWGEVRLQRGGVEWAGLGVLVGRECEQSLARACAQVVQASWASQMVGSGARAGL